MPNLNHLWQRFLLAGSLLIGLAIGITATVFGYSNLTSVDVHWSVFHINGVPLWTVAVVPLAIMLVAGTLYHWVDGLHHFTEHMRHRHRVHELEAEVASLRAHLDQVLEMPDHMSLPSKSTATVSLPPPEEQAPPPTPPLEQVQEPVASHPEVKTAVRKTGGERRKRVRVTVEPHHAAGHSNGKEAAVTLAPATPKPGA